jgi:hypothetical protein
VKERMVVLVVILSPPKGFLLKLKLKLTSLTELILIGKRRNPKNLPFLFVCVFVL